jgi:hypothetical protein
MSFTISTVDRSLIAASGARARAAPALAKFRLVSICHA